MEQGLPEELSRLHASSFGWALSCCSRDRVEAEDVLQDVYWKVLSGKARFDGRSAFRTWLFGVIRLTAIERRRWLFTRRREVTTADPPDVPSSEPRVDRETREALAKALERLSERQREVLHLTFYEGLTVEEAASIMQISLGSARTHYERGKASLLRLLQEEGIERP
jgi:RNA polymerase sigma-70 factor, ECF subfamily